MDVIGIMLLVLLGLGLAVGLVIVIVQSARFLWYYLKTKIDAFCDKHQIRTW